MHYFLFVLFLLFGLAVGGTPNLLLRSKRRQPAAAAADETTLSPLEPDEQEMLELVKERSLRGEPFSFEELGISDEREAQGWCSSMLDNMAFIPGFIDCTCRVSWAVNVIFECQASLCVSDLLDTVNNIINTTETSDMMTGLNITSEMAMSMVKGFSEGVTSLIGEPCIIPSYKAEIFTPLLGLKSEVCNQPVDINVHLPEREAYNVSLPMVCATIKHNGLTDIFSVKTCGFRVGDFDCECQTCTGANGGQGISLDCSQATAALGNELASMMTFDCVSMDLFGLDEEGILKESFVNPILLLGTEELERKMTLN